jgi:methoxymalonate biosynthesis acyl carrier protein
MNRSVNGSIVGSLNLLLAEKLHLEVPGPDTDLIESGLLDSLQLVELLVQIEQQMGCRIPLDEVDFDDLRSVARIARLVEARRERIGSTA